MEALLDAQTEVVAVVAAAEIADASVTEAVVVFEDAEEAHPSVVW